MAQRQRNPRRTMLAALKITRNRLTWIHDRWTWMGRRLNYAVPGTPRLRTPEEYPEAQASEWHMVVTQVDQAITELNNIREFAAAQYRKCLAEAGR